jgi:hypothetical protein
MQAMTPSQLTSMLVGCAKLRHYDQQLCSLLASAAVSAMPGATGSQVAMMTWALAHLKLDMPEVFAAAAQQVRVQLDYHVVACMVWPCWAIAVWKPLKCGGLGVAFPFCLVALARNTVNHE